MSQTIFITGGSGYIGKVIISLAIAQGYTVRALSRSESSDAKLVGLGATPVRGDLGSHAILADEAKKADITLSLADAIAGNFGSISMEERFALNNGAVTALGKGLEGSNKTLIVTSGSLNAAADPNGKETDEDSPRWPTSSFDGGMEACALAFKDKGVRVSVVRPAPWVYGRGGSGVQLFMEGAVQAKEMVYVEEGSACTTTVNVDDAAALYLLVAQKGKAGAIYNATSETDVTFKQIAEAIGKAVGVPVRSQSFADTEAKLGPFYARFLSLANRASNAKARNELGWTLKAEKGLFEDIESGSYVALAEELKKSRT